MQRKRMFSFMFIAVVIFLSACGKGENLSEKPLLSDVKEKDYEEIIQPNNALGFELFAEAERDVDDNLFISPTSLFMALSMVYNGATEETKEEMAQALQMDDVEAEALNKANASLMYLLQKDSESIQLAIANSIWLNEEFHFQEDFKKNAQRYFDAEIEEIDIHNNDSVKRINDWVAQATNDKITKMVESPLDPNLVTYLLNAIYFKGDWLYEFDEELTKKEDFYLKDGTKAEVSMMSLTEELRYMENDLFQAVQLPYDGETMHMTILLPTEKVEMATFHQNFTVNNWTNWQREFVEVEGTVMLPKFKISYETELNGILQQLGMERAFRKDAEFNQLIDEENPVWVSSVKQKTYLEVDEKGTEAAAVTGIDMVTESAPTPTDRTFLMEVNRPFTLLITDEETEAILFLGEIGQPMEE